MNLKIKAKKIAKRLLLAKKLEAASGKHVPDHSTWWTCFYYENNTPDELHCTHKYFGDLEETEIETIKSIIKDYFKDNPFKSFQVTFHKEEFFGKDNDIRVLTPTDYNKELFLLDLKSKLDNIKEDKFDTYRPHVTTNRDLVDLPFKGYALLFGDDIIQNYSI